VERVAVRYKQVCWLEIPMSHPIAVEVAEADEHLTRGADVLFGLDILEILKTSKRTVLHYDKRLGSLLKIYDLHNIGLSND
jgi:hypothetical protein